MGNPTSLRLASSHQAKEGPELAGKFSAVVEPIRVPSAVEAAAQSIRDAILTGKLQPGIRLVERKLASALGIGQPTLREALKELEYQGFVRKTPQKGTYVSKLNRDNVRKIREVRITLEALAVEHAAVNMTPNTELKLAGLVDRMFGAANSFDLAAFHDANVEFHRELWALAGNIYLSASLEGIALRLFVFGALNHSRKQFLASVEQHKGILEGLCSRDPQKARAAFVSHTTRFWEDTDLLDPSPSLTSRLPESVVSEDH